ncbi:MAG: hypothetical protein HYX75_09435 [Acidobacteria bacterium]|nr:hypothetical protein [Acidobacteriota bacterium]
MLRRFGVGVALTAVALLLMSPVLASASFAAMDDAANLSQARSVYSYEAAGRRDPFTSPQATVKTIPGSGLASVQIASLDLIGIARDSRGNLAVLRAPDSKTYFARIGARLADGKILAIGEGTVTFREEIRDPLSPRPFRDLTKRLNPSGE